MSKYGQQIGQGMYQGTSFVAISITTAAATAFSGYPATVIRAFVTVEGSSARYRYDGTAPVVGTGHLINSGDSVQILGLTNIQNFKCISTSAGTTTLMTTFEVDGR